MAKPGVSYEKVAAACEALLQAGQSITLRAIVANTGGSPNYLTKHWHKWQEEQQDAALKSLEEDLSGELKQAIRAECARKSQALRVDYDYLRKTTNQQIADMESLLDTRIKEKEQLRLDIAVAKDQLREQEKKTAVAEQRASDHLKDLKEVEKKLMIAEKSNERATTEKLMLEKQLTELQTRFNQLEQRHQDLQTEKHKNDLAMATLQAKEKTSNKRQE